MTPLRLVRAFLIQRLDRWPLENEEREDGEHGAVGNEKKTGDRNDERKHSPLLLRHASTGNDLEHAECDRDQREEPEKGQNEPERRLRRSWRTTWIQASIRARSGRVSRHRRKGDRHDADHYYEH